MTEVNMVPREEVSFDAMAAFADRMKWKINRKSVSAAENEESPEFIWRLRRGTVSLVKNSTLMRDYFVIDSPDQDDVTAAIQAEFPCYDLSEIVARLVNATSSDERIAALHLVAAAAPRSYDETIFHSIERNAEESQPKVRLAAVVAANHLSWKHLRSVVEQRCESDESEVLRDVCWNLLYLSSWARG